MTNVQGRNSIDFTKYGLKGKQAGIDRKYFSKFVGERRWKLFFWGLNRVVQCEKDLKTT